METRVVRALVPTAAAAALLSQEFAHADLDMDGTLFTVVIYGAAYAEVVARIRAWMSRSRVGPILVTDDATTEELLTNVTSGRSRRGLAGEAVRREPTV
jgi:hypothetical protein